MHRLVEWLERQQTESQLHGGFRCFVPKVMREHPSHDRDRERSKSFAFDAHPILEGRHAEAEASKKIASVQRQRLLERRRRPLHGATLKTHHVHHDPRGLEPDHFALGSDCSDSGFRESVAEVEKALAKTMTGGPLALLFP